MQITTVTAREGPTTMMKSDRMVSTYSFDHSFKVIIPKKEAWLNSEKLPLPSGSSVVYTDGSCSTGKTGAGVYIESLGHTESVPLDIHTSIFQAEVYAVMHGAQILEQFGVNNKQISICCIKGTKQPQNYLTIGLGLHCCLTAAIKPQCC